MDNKEHDVIYLIESKALGKNLLQLQMVDNVDLELANKTCDDVQTC